MITALTTTDWDKELDLLKEYIGWRVDNFYHLPIVMNVTNIPTNWNAETLFRLYRETGVLFYNIYPEPEFKMLTFDEWRALRND